LIQYYNNDGVLVQATSYPECYNGDDKNQVKVEKTDAGASVSYTFGESEEAGRIFYSGRRKFYQVIPDSDKARRIWFFPPA